MTLYAFSLVGPPISVAWLENYLQQYRGTVCAITHDRYFLDNVARWILEVDNGKCFPFSGNYSEWLASKHQRVDNEKKKTEARDRVIERELEWIKKNSGRGAITKGLRARVHKKGIFSYFSISKPHYRVASFRLLSLIFASTETIFTALYF